MEKKFLEVIAEKILALSATELANLIVILPNKRSIIFLQKYISRMATKTTWLPEIYSIEDYIFKFSRLGKATNSDLLFELYETYLQMGITSEKSFEDFGTFGPGLLKDFNEIDNYLADAEIVFTFLKEARTLQKWNPNSTLNGNFEENYLNFYLSLKDYYKNFKAKLFSQNIAYYGMAIRHLVENNEEILSKKNRYFIVGFNATTKAEQKLFELLTIEKEAITFIDSDAYYLSDQKQEAGKDIRNLLKNTKLNIILVKTDNFSNKEINIKGLTGEYSMAKYAAQIIKKWIKEPDFDQSETAIILPDEELLFPLISSLTNEIKDINITMSYPFRKTSGYDLIVKAFEIYESAHRYYSSNNKITFHHHSISNLLKNNIFQSAFYDFSRIIQAEMKNKNISYLDINIVKSIMKNNSARKQSIPDYIFELNDFSGTCIISKIIKLINHIVELSNLDDFNQKILLENKEILRRLQDKLIHYQLDENAIILKKIIIEMALMNGIPFEGKPLAGLQIMGTLETRAIDFKRIIYLSFNEGQFPKSSQFRSFILPEIRYHFGLPMPVDEESIAAYHFYRSIQRAEKTELLYNTSTGALGGGEMSRFGRQLKIELNSEIVTESIIELPKPKKTINQNIEYFKSNSVIEKLLKIASKNHGFSPTALSTYLSCSLKFYFRYILNIKALNEIEEEIAYNTRGLAIHNTLEILYKNEAQTNNKFDDNFFEYALKNYKIFLARAYEEAFKNGDTEHGYNLILKKLDEKLLENFIFRDKNYSNSTKELLVEQKLSGSLDFEYEGKTIEINFSGTADRIDYHNGIRRIIDYKTGTVKQGELILHSAGENSEIWYKIFIEGKFQKTFQLMMYSFLYQQINPKETSILPAIAALKNTQVFYELKPKDSLIGVEIIDEFKIELKKLIESIFDRKIPFSQTNQTESCRNCEFIKVCNR